MTNKADYTTLKAKAEAANRPMSEIGLMEHKRAAIKAMHDLLLPDDVLSMIAEIEQWKIDFNEFSLDCKRKDALIRKLHAAKGRYHTQLAACDLFDAVGLKNEGPVK